MKSFVPDGKGQVVLADVDEVSPAAGQAVAAVDGTAPAVRVELNGSRYASLLVTVPDTEGTAAVITAAAGVRS